MAHKSTALKLKVKKMLYVFGVWQISAFAASVSFGDLSVIIIRNCFFK